MKHKKTVKVPATTREIVEKVTCDLCKSEIKRSQFDVSEVTIEFREGVSYPEGGHGTRTELDICGDCFQARLMPWLKAQGAEPEQIEWEH